MNDQLFRLWYRRGGTANFTWHLTTSVDTCPTSLQRSGTDVRRAGYPTVVITIDAPAPTEFAPEGMKS